MSSLVRGSRTWLVGLAVSLSIFAALALGACGSSSNASVNKALDQANQAEQQGLGHDGIAGFYKFWHHQFPPGNM